MKKNIRDFLLLTTFAASGIHAINRFISSTAEMKNILSSTEEDFYNWRNGSIYYTKRGTGSPILLIHNLDPMSSSYEWSRLTKKLEKNHTVYTLDLLGCGRSEKPCLTYTCYLYVQLVTDFIKDIIGEKSSVLVSSNSLPFVILANHMNKDIIDKIIAINPPELDSLQPASEDCKSMRKTLLELPVIGTFIYHIQTSNAFITKTFQEKYYANPQHVSTNIVDAYYESAHKYNSSGKYLMASMEGRYTNNSISHALEQLDTPLYLIQSKYGKDYMKKIDAYCQLNNKIETVYVSNAKELPQLELPSKISEMVTMFLNN